MFRNILKWGSLFLVGMMMYRSVWPAVSDAWKTRQAAVKIAGQSYGKSKKEVEQDYLAELKSRGVQSVTAPDVTIEKSGERWIVGASYEVANPIYSNASLVYEFSVSSDRRSIWQAPE